MNIRAEVEDERLKEDLPRYVELAKELGATNAAIVDRASWFVDPRVTLKCTVPRCHNYGRCANCPPHSFSAAETVAIIDKYRKAILVRWEYKKGLPREEDTLLRRSAYTTLADIEAAAFYDGYYFACGFSAGSCNRNLCNGAPCQELEEPLKGCRFPLLARPSMEAVGFDVYRTATAAGWTIYPAGGHCPDVVPSLSRMGIVLVA